MRTLKEYSNLITKQHDLLNSNENSPLSRMTLLNMKFNKRESQFYTLTLLL